MDSWVLCVLPSEMKSPFLRPTYKPEDTTGSYGPLRRLAMMLRSTR